jgi:hypothetical protein
MTIELDHTIVPARDKEASARFFARIFGLEYEGGGSHFAPVRVNDRLTLDFSDSDDERSLHYAFKVRAKKSSRRSSAVFRPKGSPTAAGPSVGRTCSSTTGMAVAASISRIRMVTFSSC